MSWLEALGFFRRSPDARPAAQIEADVRAEIEHHVACAERELVEQGRTREEARAAALERFGDVAAARVACLGIQNGERIMLQRIHFAVTVLLLLAMLALAWSTHRSSQAAVRASEVAAALRLELGERKAPAPVPHVIVEVGDKIQLTDRYNPGEVNGVVEVAADGKIPVPEAGWVYVAGKTREEVEKELTKLLSSYFVECEVQVIVKKRAAFESMGFDAF